MTIVAEADVIAGGDGDYPVAARVGHLPERVDHFVPTLVLREDGGPLEMAFDDSVDFIERDVAREIELKPLSASGRRRESDEQRQNVTC